MQTFADRYYRFFDEGQQIGVDLVVRFENALMQKYDPGKPAIMASNHARQECRYALAIVLASMLSRLSYQMARTPVLPIFAADLGAMPELIGVIVAASTVTGVFFKLPSGALSDVLGRKRMMVLGALFFAAPPFLYPFVYDAWSLLALRFV